MKVTILLAVICLTATSLNAQERSDFTGRWVLTTSADSGSPTEIAVRFAVPDDETYRLLHVPPSASPDVEFLRVERRFSIRASSLQITALSRSIVDKWGTGRRGGFA